jgi:hypothetical protein
MTQTFGSDNIERIRHPEYVEAVSKDTGGRVEWFECPHCSMIFDAFGAAAQMALDQCVAHARTCNRAAPGAPPR